MANKVFPKNNLPPQSTFWGREVEKRVKELEAAAFNAKTLASNSSSSSRVSSASLSALWARVVALETGGGSYLPVGTPLSGLGTNLADYNMQTFKLTNLSEPALDGDSATKLYVDTSSAALETQIDGKLQSVPTEIGNAVNLNDFTTSGLFIQSSNAEAAAGSNYPVAYAGLLEVYARADAAFIYQRYTTYQPYNVVYHRSNYIGTWSAWKAVSTVGHTHAISDVTDLSTTLSGKAASVHTHAISDVTGLQTELDSKLTGAGFTANRVLVSSGAGDVIVSTTIDTTELGYLNGVTSNIQTQIGSKANNSGYTASRVLISDASGNLVVSPLISTTELDYLDNVSSNIQTQLNGKSATGHTHITSEVTGLDSALAGKASTTHTHAIADVTGLQTALDGKLSGSFPTGNRVMITDATGAATISGTIDTTELGYLNGVTSGIQSQLNSKAEAGSNGVPFAMAANRTTTAGGSALAVNTQETATTVTFPTSRFSVTPSVTANTSSPRYAAAVTSASSTGFTFIVRNVSDATGTTYTWNWIAVQMTSGAVSG
jgi:hypothetical protein